MTGLLTTLGDQKANLFYLGFFPAFVNLAALSSADMLLILAVATIAVGGPKFFYAFLAERAGNRFRASKVGKTINVVAGVVLVGVGVFLVREGIAGALAAKRGFRTNARRQIQITYNF